MMTDREEFEKFLKDNFLYDTSGFIQNEAERKKAQDESFVWRAWQARGELDAVKIKELESRLTIQYIDLDRLIGALEVLAKLGGGTSEGNMIAKQALAYGVPKESEVN
jgi:hypothetical protein